MQKTASYHRAAIEYNEGFADFAAEMAEKLEHEEVKKWCRSISSQHKFHANNHRRSLNALEKKEKRKKEATEKNAETTPETPDDSPTEAPAPSEPTPAEPAPSTPDPEKAVPPVENSGAGVGTDELKVEFKA